jgi:P27 family predicted phage terminase small subunit
MAGRPRKPTAKHKLDGTFRKDRHGDRADVGMDLPGQPIMPAGLSDDARELWVRVVGQLTRSKVAVEIDTSQLEAMCRWWARYLENERHACEFSHDIEAGDMYEKRAKRAWDAFDKVASRFGLTPADRAKLKLPEDKNQKTDPLKEFGIVG